MLSEDIWLLVSKNKMDFRLRCVVSVILILTMFFNAFNNSLFQGLNHAFRT